MTGINDEWHYMADATAVVKKDPDGRYIEDFHWTRMSSNGPGTISTSPILTQDRVPTELTSSPARVSLISI
jgi:hypothetical protein